MIATVLGVSAIAMIALVAVTAVNGDIHQTQNDLAHKQAYEAAKAGIDEYNFHLRGNGNYWATCAGIGKRAVPGNAGASYAVELLPATGHASCETLHPASSMIETSGAMKGTFRIRSTGYAEKTHISITTTFKTASFLDYVYFTQLETPDPLTYAFTNAKELEEGYKQCSLTEQEGRYSKSIPNTTPSRECEQIAFKTGDHLNGPVHSNDTFAICGSPEFGHNSLDPVEVSALSPGWVPAKEAGKKGSGCPTAKPNFVGTFSTGVPPLVPPPTNAELQTLTEPEFRYTGQVNICLKGNSMTVATTKLSKTCETKETGKILYNNGALPKNGLVYVASSSCTPSYSPWTATYPTTSTCGNVYVHGTYSGQLTIAAGNDIIIDGEIAHTENGLLGLIANGFIRVFHAYPTEKIEIVEKNGKPTGVNIVCGTGAGEEKLENLRIDAAILSINHSFIVDHYNCGNALGTLTVNGAISQKFRGTVGTQGGNGYVKSYNYDERLKYLEPPSFIEPEKLPWVIGRETIG
ncbi:MAG TPA: hypothetical protein VGN84_00855 [Solirubrobacterales bacterium]|jgi:hypothetical protein|nr:hypothetical protein [Solirubrobacterales bacterium]